IPRTASQVRRDQNHSRFSCAEGWQRDVGQLLTSETGIHFEPTRRNAISPANSKTAWLMAVMPFSDLPLLQQTPYMPAVPNLAILRGQAGPHGHGIAPGSA